jgi:hypothetical protein
VVRIPEDEISTGLRLEYLKMKYTQECGQIPEDEISTEL